MRFKRIDPSKELSTYIECYWVVESDHPPHEQKIIPDGFPEMIFHYGEPYEIDLNGAWELQDKALIAGQISQHFLLRNRGYAKMLGLKFRPAAIGQLFNIDMSRLLDKVVSLHTLLDGHFQFLIGAPLNTEDPVGLITQIEKYLSSQIPTKPAPVASFAADAIHQTRGTVSIADLCTQLDVSERTLERSFKKYIGMAPKYYARIIRFNHIFELIQNKSLRWADLVYESGYYDQSHFIRDFKKFSGEDPTRYIFDEPNLANFFLKKN